jgi:hypothetical protein
MRQPLKAISKNKASTMKRHSTEEVLTKEDREEVKAVEESL